MKTVTLTSKQLEILCLALEELKENEHINEGLNDDGTPIDPEDLDSNFPLTTKEMEELNRILFGNYLPELRELELEGIEKTIRDEFIRWIDSEPMRKPQDIWNNICDECHDGAYTEHETTEPITEDELEAFSIKYIKYIHLWNPESQPNT